MAVGESPAFAASVLRAAAAAATSGSAQSRNAHGESVCGDGDFDNDDEWNDDGAAADEGMQRFASGADFVVAALASSFAATSSSFASSSASSSEPSSSSAEHLSVPSFSCHTDGLSAPPTLASVARSSKASSSTGGSGGGDSFGDDDDEAAQDEAAARAPVGLQLASTLDSMLSRFEQDPKYLAMVREFEDNNA
jgi:hypothetical protein